MAAQFPIHPDQNKHTFDLAILNNFLRDVISNSAIDAAVKEDIKRVINNLKFIKCNLNFISYLYEKKFSAACYQFGIYQKKFDIEEDSRRKILRDFEGTSIDLFFYKTAKDAILFLKDAITQYENVIEQMRTCKLLINFAKSIQYDEKKGCIAARLDPSLKFAANVLSGILNIHDLMQECVNQIDKEFSIFSDHIKVRNILKFIKPYLGLDCLYDDRTEVITQPLVIKYCRNILELKSDLNTKNEYQEFCKQCEVQVGFHGMIQHRFSTLKTAEEFLAWLKTFDELVNLAITRATIKQEKGLNQRVHYVVRITKEQLAVLQSEPSDSIQNEILDDGKSNENTLTGIEDNFFDFMKFYSDDTHKNMMANLIITEYLQNPEFRTGLAPQFLRIYADGNIALAYAMKTKKKYAPLNSLIEIIDIKILKQAILIKDREQQTLLHIAVSSGYYKLLERLSNELHEDDYYEILMSSDKNNNNIFHVAAKASWCCITQLLPPTVHETETLQSCLKQRNNVNLTPLHIAAAEEKAYSLKINFIEYAAPDTLREILLAESKNNIPFLISLINYKCPEAFLILLNKIICYDILDMDFLITHMNRCLEGENILHYLMEEGFLGVVKNLYRLLRTSTFINMLLQPNKKNIIPLIYLFERWLFPQSMLLDVLENIDFFNTNLINLNRSIGLGGENIFHYLLKDKLVSVIKKICSTFKPEIFSAMMLKPNKQNIIPLTYLFAFNKFPENILVNIVQIAQPNDLLRFESFVEDAIINDPFKILYFFAQYSDQTIADFIIKILHKENKIIDKHIFTFEKIINDSNDKFLKKLDEYFGLPRLIFEEKKHISFFKIFLDFILFKHFDKLSNSFIVSLLRNITKFLISKENICLFKNSPSPYVLMHTPFMLIQCIKQPACIIEYLKTCFSSNTHPIKIIVDNEVDPDIALRAIANLVNNYFEIYENFNHEVLDESKEMIHELMLILWPLTRELLQIPSASPILESYYQSIKNPNKIVTAQGSVIDINDIHNPNQLKQLVREGIFHPFEITKLQQHGKLEAIKLCVKLLKASCFSGTWNIKNFDAVLDNVLDGRTFFKTFRSKDRKELYMRMLADLTYRPLLRVQPPAHATHKLDLTTNNIIPYEKKDKQTKPTENKLFLKKNSTTLISSQLQTRLFIGKEDQYPNVAIVICPNHKSSLLLKKQIAAMLKIDQGTIKHKWIDTEENVKKFQELMQYILYTNFEDFKKYVEESVFMNEVLLRYNVKDIIAVAIPIDDLPHRKEARKFKKELESKFGKEFPIIFYDYHESRIWEYTDAQQQIDNSYPGWCQKINFHNDSMILQHAKHKCLKIKEYLLPKINSKNILFGFFDSDNIKAYKLIVEKIDRALDNEQHDNVNFSWPEVLREILIRLRITEDQHKDDNGIDGIHEFKSSVLNDMVMNKVVRPLFKC